MAGVGVLSRGMAMTPPGTTPAPPRFVGMRTDDIRRRREAPLSEQHALGRLGHRHATRSSLDVLDAQPAQVVEAVKRPRNCRTPAAMRQGIGTRSEPRSLSTPRSGFKWPASGRTNYSARSPASMCRRSELEADYSPLLRMLPAAGMTALEHFARIIS